MTSLKEKGEAWLFNSFEEHFLKIVEQVFKADIIQFYGEKYSIFTTKPSNDKTGFIINYAPETKSVYDYRGKGIGKIINPLDKEPCRYCGKNHAKKIKHIQIRHYKELMWLLGLSDRKGLHPYFRQYRAHDLIPYTGNSLLEQTHPYTSIKDPLSKDKPNGLEFYVYVCGHCKNKLSKDSNEILDIHIENV